MSLSKVLPKQLNNKHLAGPDHLRALAIILVFFYHYRIFAHPSWLDDITGFGWTGVDLFFVLSGYLIGGQLLNRVARNQPVLIGEFYFKRFLRIIPAYLVILTLYFTVPGFTEKQGLAPLWKFLTFTQNIGLDLQSQHGFSHAWSLCIEEQFYLVLPFIIILLSRFKMFKKGWVLLIALFAGGMAIRYYNLHRFVEPLTDDDFGTAWYKWIYYPTYARLDGLLAGISIAAFIQFKPVLWDRLKGYGNLLLMAALILIIVSWYVCRDQTSFNATIIGFPLIAIAYGALLIAALSPMGILYKFNSTITSTIARISYSVYLSHKACIHFTQWLFTKFGIEGDGIIMLIICTITSIIAGFLLHLLIERPFLKLRDSWLAKKYPNKNLQKIILPGGSNT